MAARQPRTEPAIVDRIQQHRKPRKPAPPSHERLSAVRTVVRESSSVDDAIAAVKGIAAAWKDATPATRDAIGLLIAILELSDSTDEALATFAMLNGDGALLEPLTEVRSFVSKEFPDARMRIVPGDEVSASYLDVRIPTEDYPSFWEAHLRVRDWVIAHVPDMTGVIQVTPLPTRAHV